MKKSRTHKNPLKNERGVSIVLVAILIIGTIAITALAIDYGHLYVVRNELRDAADAGALAGASSFIRTMERHKLRRPIR